MSGEDAAREADQRARLLALRSGGTVHVNCHVCGGPMTVEAPVEGAHLKIQAACFHVGDAVLRKAQKEGDTVTVHDDGVIEVWRGKPPGAGG